MNFTKALDVISSTDRKIKKLNEASGKLSLAMAAIAEIENGASISVRLECTGKDDTAEMCIDGVVDVDKLTKIIVESLNITATKNYLYLSGGGNTIGEKKPQTEIPEKGRLCPPQPTTPKMPEKKPVFETPEAPKEEPQPEKPKPEEITKQPEPQQEKVTKARGKVNRDQLANLYFKQGKTAKEIVKETGLGESTVYKVLNELRAEKIKTAKECVRR